MGLLGIFVNRGLQVENAIKNLLQAIVNLVAAIFFIFSSMIAWDAVGAIAIGSLAGSLAGASLAQRIPTRPFRIGIVVFGVVMTVLFAFMALPSG